MAAKWKRNGHRSYQVSTNVKAARVITVICVDKKKESGYITEGPENLH